MSQDSNFLKNTLDLLETDPEVKSYIYQQITEFNQFVTPETLVMVIARDPNSVEASDLDEESHDEADYSVSDEDELALIDNNYKFRIAIILKDEESSIEAEAWNNDVFDAIRLAKEKLIERLIEIQDEIENPKDRMKAIKEASENKIIH